MKDKLKKLNFKKAVRIFTLLWGLVLIVVMSITSIGFDRDFDFLQWLANALILVGIMVFGLVLGESMGIDTQMERIGGLYQTRLSTYNALLKSIEGILIYFVQFYSWFVPKRVRQKKIDHLISSGMIQTKAEQIVDYCYLEDFEPLKEHAILKKLDNGEEIIIRKLEQNEVEATREVLSGEVKLQFVKVSYYLSAFADANAPDITEEGIYIDQQIRFNKKSTRSVKIVSSLVVSLAWGLLTANDFINGNDPQAWFNLVSRLTALFTSLLSGWMSGTYEVKLRAKKLKNKINMLTIFKTSLDKKVFIPESENELAKKEYEKYLKEQEEAKSKVVEPEVVSKEDTPQVELHDDEIKQIAESNMFKDLEVDINSIDE